MSKVFERIIASKRLPVLFLGAGMSKRYLLNYPSWEQLLDYAREKIGISKTAYAAKIHEIKSQDPSIAGGKLNQKMASFLQERFLRQIQEDRIDLRAIFTDEEIHACENGVDFFKMLVSKPLLTYRINDERRDELELFRKIGTKISMVFTTNYDLFLQNEVFQNFKVYESQNKYYFRTSNGYGELYKIHGDVDSPNGIVINEKDYELFDSALKLISSKLLNALLDYPVIFMGYSLEDENIRKILIDFVNSFDESILNEIKKYIILVEYEEGQDELIEGEKQFSDDATGKAIILTTIKTDNFEKIYSYIDQLTPSASTYELRKYKAMVATLISREAKGEKTIYVQELDEAKADAQALYIGSRGSIENIEKSVRMIENADIIKKVLMNESVDCDSLAKYWYENKGIGSTEYTPIYYILKNMTIPFDECGRKFKKNLDAKERTISNYKIRNKKASLITAKEKYDKLKEEKRDMSVICQSVCSDLTDALMLNTIEESQCKEVLINLLQEYPAAVENSSFKKSACFMWYKEYKAYKKA